MHPKVYVFVRQRKKLETSVGLGRRRRRKGRHFFDNLPAIFGERVMYKLWVPPIFFKIIVPDRNYSVRYYIHHCFLKQTTMNVIESLGDYRAAF